MLLLRTTSEHLTIKMRRSLPIAALVISLSLQFNPCLAYVVCTSGITSTRVIRDSLVISGGSCTIKGMHVTGSVLVSNGATLTTEGKVLISGKLLAWNSGTIKIGGGTQIRGDVEHWNTGSTLSVASSANVGSIIAMNASVMNSGTFDMYGVSTVAIRLSGTAKSIYAKDSAVEVNGGTVLAGITMNGESRLRVCKGTVTGGIKVSGSTQEVDIFGSDDCFPTMVSGSVAVTKGNTSVSIFGGTFKHSDLIVSDFADLLSGVTVYNTAFENVNLMLNGAYQADFDNVVVRGDFSTQIDSAEQIILRNCKISGATTIRGGNQVTLFNNQFGKSVVSISQVIVEAIISNNKYTSMSVLRNAAKVIFSNNFVRAGVLRHNTGGVMIFNNTFDNVQCSGNRPPPMAMSNSVRGTSTGQCAAL